MKKKLFLLSILFIGFQCGTKPTAPVLVEPIFPITSGSWWQYRQMQCTKNFNRQDSVVVYDTILWTIGANKANGKSLIIKTFHEGNVTLDTVGLIVAGDAIYASGYTDLAGSTPLFKVAARVDTTLLVPGKDQTSWMRGTVAYSVEKDTTVIWKGITHNCRLISEERNNKLISMVTLGTLGFIKKEYTPDTLISFSDTIITFATLELDTFQIR